MAFFLTAQNDKNLKHAKKTWILDTSQQLGALQGTSPATSDEFNGICFLILRVPRFGDTLR